MTASNHPTRGRALATGAKMLAGATVALAMAACGTVPARVTISKDLPNPSTLIVEAPIQFQLRQSRITVHRIDGSGKKANAEPDGKTADHSHKACLEAAARGVVPLGAIAGPVGFDTKGEQLPIYTMTGSDDLLSTTDLTVSYIPETKLVSKIGINVTDNLTTTITEMGTVVAAALPLFTALATASPKQAKSLEEVACGVTTAMINPYERDWQPLNDGKGEPTGLIYNVELISDKGAVERDFFFATRKTASKVVPVTACATANITLALSKGGDKPDTKARRFVLSAQVADERLVVPFNLPSKGAIELGPVCGGNITVEPGAPRNAELKAAAEFFKQAEAIRKAANPG